MNRRKLIRIVLSLCLAIVTCCSSFVKDTSENWINAKFTKTGVSGLSIQKNNSRVGAYTFEKWDSKY